MLFWFQIFTRNIKNKKWRYQFRLTKEFYTGNWMPVFYEHSDIHYRWFDKWSISKFDTSQVSRKTLFIPSKFYFKNRKLMNGQVNLLLKINVNVEVFFFTTTFVSATDQFWLINDRVSDWFCLISFNDNCSFFFITAFLVVNSKIWLKKIRQRYGRQSRERFQGSLIVKHVFLKTFEATIWLIFLFFLSFPSLPNVAQPDHGIINLIIFLRYLLFGFYSREKIADKNLLFVIIWVK